MSEGPLELSPVRSRQLYAFIGPYVAVLAFGGQSVVYSVPLNISRNNLKTTLRRGTSTETLVVQYKNLAERLTVPR
jgi:hypothetical protein